MTKALDLDKRDRVDKWMEGKAALRSWHAGLVDDRGGRAALRRAQSPDDAFDILAFHRLCRGLNLGTNEALVTRWAGAALAVAEIDENTEDGDDETRVPTLGAALAVVRDGQPVISPERVRLLANTEEPDLFLRLLRGMLAMIDRKAPVAQVADIVRSWHFPDRRAAARRRLLLTYFEKIPSSLLEKNDD
jgi:CRISPR system Cascade subunit CasB